MSPSLSQYRSHRGFPLVYYGNPPAVPTLTIENYIKWYTIYLVMPDGAVCIPTALNDDCEAIAGPLNISAWCDHVPNPVFCLQAAKIMNWRWDETSLEMIIGRFVHETEGRDFALPDKETP